MRAIFEFEIKKFCLRKKNIITILILMGFTIFFIVANNSLDEKSSSSESLRNEQYIQSIESNLLKINEDIEKNPENTASIDIKNKEELNLDILHRMQSAYESKNMKEYLKCKNEFNEKQLIEVKSGQLSGENTKDIENKIQIDTFLLDNNINPINTYYSMEGLNYIRLYLSLSIIIIILLFVAILSADIVSSEFERETYKLLFTQPISKVKIYFGKLITLFFIVYTIVFGVILFSFLCLVVWKGMGAINYPTYYYNGNQIALVGITKVLLPSLLLLVFAIAFVTTLAFTLSGICKNSVSSISFSVIIIFLGLLMVSNNILPGIAHLNPFVYFDISGVVSGNVSILSGNHDVDFIHGFFVLGISTLILVGSNLFHLIKVKGNRMQIISK